MVEHEGQEDPQGASSYSDFSAELADKLLAEQASVGLTSDDLVLAGMIKSGQKLSDFVFAKLMFGESLQEEAFKDFFNYLPESDGYNLEEISRDVFSRSFRNDDCWVYVVRRKTFECGELCRL